MPLLNVDLAKEGLVRQILTFTNKNKKQSWQITKKTLKTRLMYSIFSVFSRILMIPLLPATLTLIRVFNGYMTF